jgi:hypothetical protein
VTACALRSSALCEISAASPYCSLTGVSKIGPLNRGCIESFFNWPVTIRIGNKPPLDHSATPGGHPKTATDGLQSHLHILLFKVGEVSEIDSRQLQCGSNRVSSESLPKTGIFAVVAGDFCPNCLRVLQFGSSETGTELQKPANGRLFAPLRAISRFGNGWLTWQDSNSDIPSLQNPFEKFEEFRAKSRNPGLETFGTIFPANGNTETLTPRSVVKCCVAVPHRRGTPSCRRQRTSSNPE